MSFNEDFDDIYSPDTPDYQNETKPLDEVIRNAIETALYELHTWLPAQVVNVLPNGNVNIQPLLQRRYTDGTLQTLTPIQNVMVGMPSGADYWVKLPVSVGDVGIALFCERSLDTWGVAGGIQDPADPRRHNLSDVIFIPGIRTANVPIPGTVSPSNTDMVLHNGKAEIYLQKTGKFKITNGTNELLSVLNQVLTDLINALVITGIGPQPFTTTTIDALTADQEHLDTLKGT